MTKIIAEILRDAALRPTNIKVKGLKVDFEFYPSGAVSKVILSGRRASIPKLFSVLDMIYPRDVIVSIRGSEYYDRNPKLIKKIYHGTDVAPHASTTRWSYRVPVDRVAIAELFEAKVQRSAAAAPVGKAQAVIQHAAATMRLANIDTNSVGDKDSSVGHGVIFFAEDILEGKTFDGSTGGTVNYTLVIKLTEFDA